MSKVRINDLARELEVKSKAILDTLPLVGVTEKKTHSSSLEEHEAEKVRAYLRSSAEGSSPAGKSTSRTLRGEEEIKTKIDLSNISRPGDVLKAITQRKEAVAPTAPLRPHRRQLRMFRRRSLRRLRLRGRSQWLRLRRLRWLHHRQFRYPCARSLHLLLRYRHRLHRRP